MLSLKNKLSRIFWQSACVACGTIGKDLCENCQNALKPIGQPLCIICGKPFLGSTPDHPCGKCLEHKPHYDHHRSLFVFDGPAREMVHKLKYNGEFWITRFIKPELMRYTREFAKTQIIIPVPLHTERLRERGFNQAALIAKEWSRELKRPVKNVLQRKIKTSTQTTLDRAERIQNLKNAFEADAAALRNISTVLLVDDVHTTGATLDSCAITLKAAGVEKVLAMSLAMA